MAYLTEKKFSFLSKAPSLDAETFAVVSFKGFEGISKPYEFNIMLVSDNADIDLSEVLQFPAKITFHREEGGDVDYNGILDQFEQLHEFEGYVFYRAHLVPKLWWLSLTHHNQVILNKTVPDFIEDILKDGGLTTMDFEFKLQNSYPEIDYVCQYDESHFNFISRWLESEGIYYYFEQTDNSEKVIFTDTKISHTDLPQEANLFYSPPSGLDTLHRTETIKSFTCRQRQLPQKVLLKDYNYERPSLEISGSANVDENGRGESYIYGEHFPTTEEGNRLAALRAEEFLCHKTEFFGESTVPFIEPGYTFNLEDHFRESFNRKYLITELSHEGTQTGFLISGIRNGLSEMEEKVYFLNQFTAIPSDVQFRPKLLATKPPISGTLHARIDAEGSGTYAELDDQGRYKVRLPFDMNSEHGDGKASSFLRMMQPYTGSDHGMHFPLHKGTEVLLTFINGDPDRPVIAGAIPNPETPSQVTADNQTMAMIQTGGQNKIAIEDNAGSERILIQTPKEDSWIRMGAPNDPPPAGDEEADEPDLDTSPTDEEYITDHDTSADGIKIKTDGKLVLKSEDDNVEIIAENGKIIQKESSYWHETSGESHEYVHAAKETLGFSNDLSIILGAKESVFAGVDINVTLALILSLAAAYKWDFHTGGTFERDKSWNNTKSMGPICNESKTKIRSNVGDNEIVIDKGSASGIEIVTPKVSIELKNEVVTIKAEIIKLVGEVQISENCFIDGQLSVKGNTFLKGKTVMKGAAWAEKHLKMEKTGACVGVLKAPLINK